MDFKYYRCAVCGSAFPESYGKYGCCEKAAKPIPLTGERDDHHPDCCCQFNPDSAEILDVVLGSNCCPVHNQSPIECQACPKCKVKP